MAARPLAPADHASVTWRRLTRLIAAGQPPGHCRRGRGGSTSYRDHSRVVQVFASVKVNWISRIGGSRCDRSRRNCSISGRHACQKARRVRSGPCRACSRIGYQRLRRRVRRARPSRCPREYAYLWLGLRGAGRQLRPEWHRRDRSVLDHPRPAVARLGPVENEYCGAHDVMNGAPARVLDARGYQVTPFGTGGSRPVPGWPDGERAAGELVCA